MPEAATVRPPAVCGSFYEAHPERLRRQVEECFGHPVGPGRLPRPWGRGRVRALIVPHAGLMYSGPVAAHAYLALAEAARPALIVIVGPDHHGLGPRVALAPEAWWRTPLGDVHADHPARAALGGRGVAVDGRGHRHEHSIEVQLPFLQLLGYGGPVVPVVMAGQDAASVEELAAALAGTLTGVDVTLIASTDLSHYLPHDDAVQADRALLLALEAGDGLALLREVGRRGSTMCGAGPAAAVLAVARRLGAGGVRVLRYATSGETGGGRDSVVGYAAAVLAAA